MINKRFFGAVLLSLSVVAAACGGSGDDDAGGGGETATLDSNVKSEVANQLGGATGSTTETTAATEDTVALPTSPEEIESFAAAERQKVIDRIKENGWGVDEATNTLKGPDGFTVDLNACPQGWSNVEGITDTEIKIGVHTALSGTLADYGNMAKAWQTYVDKVNAEGGIEDVTGKKRKITLVVKDDGYDATRAIPLVDELLDSDKTFLIFGGGSALIMRTYDKVNQRCVPHPMVWTGHPAWGDPVNHPWTMGSILNYFTEAILWGSYIEQTMPKGTKVGAVVINNDFGAAYTAGFQAFMAQSDHDISFEFEKFEPAAPTIKNEMTTVASKDPDVFIAMTAGITCTQAIVEAAENGLTTSADQLWMPSVCKPLSFVGEQVVGEASDGWLIAGGAVMDINDPTMAEEPGIKFARDLLTDAGIDPKLSSSFSAGFYLGWPIIEMLRIASQLDGGLTRANYLLAMRTMDMTSPFLLPGVRMQTSGNTDAFVIEGSEIGRFSAEKQTWIQEGDIIDLGGDTAPCAWDQSIANCK
ncbi:MAG: ABC transporter substrate-binding protein [Acidimicrobiales bacterium]